MAVSHLGSWLLLDDDMFVWNTWDSCIWFPGMFCSHSGLFLAGTYISVQQTPLDVLECFSSLLQVLWPFQDPGIQTWYLCVCFLLAFAVESKFAQVIFLTKRFFHLFTLLTWRPDTFSPFTTVAPLTDWAQSRILHDKGDLMQWTQ